MPILNFKVLILESFFFRPKRNEYFYVGGALEFSLKKPKIENQIAHEL